MTTNSPDRPIVLFDLDGTLIRPDSTLLRAHMATMAEAVAAVNGRTTSFSYRDGGIYYEDVRLAGYTDASTIRAILSRTGIPDGELADLVPVVIHTRIQLLDRTVAGTWSAGDTELQPGSRHLLERLHRDGFRLGMSTGNARAAAHWKVRRTRLAHLLHAGGFGDSASEREDVVGAAATSFGGTGYRYGVVIGDTPRDVAAAHQASLPCVAVANGTAATVHRVLDRHRRRTP